MLRDYYNSNLSNGTISSVLIQHHLKVHGVGICTHGLSREAMSMILMDLQKQQISQYVKEKKSQMETMQQSQY